MAKGKAKRTEYSPAPRGKGRQRRKRGRSAAPFGLTWKILTALLVICVLGGAWLYNTGDTGSDTAVDTGSYTGQPRQTMEDWPDLDVELLDVNPYSRPGLALKQVNGIVVHYTANPGSSAQQNRDYFANLATTHTTKASSHFIIGLEGEIIQCVPCSEMSYASNSRNSDTIAIECCIPGESGAFNDATYDSLVELTAWLVCRYDLTTDDVIRHYDITGKDCPKYFVEHPDAWESFLSDVGDYIEKYS